MKLALTGSRILVWRGLQKLAGALVVLAVAHGLGPEGNGRYSLTLLVVTVAASLLSGGVGLASVPPLRRGEVAPRRILAAQGLWGLVVLVVLLVLLAVVRLTPLWTWLVGTLTWDVSLLIAAVAAMLAMMVFETANYDLLAAGEVVVGTRTASLRAMVQLVAVGALLAVWRLDLTLAIWSFTAVQMLAALYLVTRVRVAAPRFPQPAPTVPPGPRLPALLGGIVRAGWIGQLSAISYLLLLRLDQVLLENYLDVAAVGIYSLAAWGAELLWLVPEALNPLLVHTSSAQDDPGRDHTAARAVRLGLSATALAAIPLALVLPPLMGLLREGAFADAATPLRVLLPGVVAFAPGAVLAGDFIGRGKPNWNTQASAVTLGVNVGLCVLWIPRWGILGAAWASSVAYAVGAGIMLVRFRRMTGLGWTVILVPRPSDLRR